MGGGTLVSGEEGAWLHIHFPEQPRRARAPRCASGHTAECAGRCACGCWDCAGAGVRARAHKLETRRPSREPRGRGPEQTHGTAVGRGSPWERNSSKTGTPLKSPQSPQVWFEYLASSSSWKEKDMSATGPARDVSGREGQTRCGTLPRRGCQGLWTSPRPPQCTAGLSVLEETPHSRGVSIGGCRSQRPHSTWAPSSPTLVGTSNLSDLPTPPWPEHFLPSLGRLLGWRRPPTPALGPGLTRRLSSWLHMKTRPSLATTFRWLLLCSMMTPDWLKGSWILRREGAAEAARGAQGAARSPAVTRGTRAQCLWTVAAGGVGETGESAALGSQDQEGTTSRGRKRARGPRGGGAVGPRLGDNPTSPSQPPRLTGAR